MLRQPARATCQHGHNETDIQQRMEVIEKALRLQTAVGASHLQQVELDPAAFGLPVAARSPVRRLRRKRNRALHVVTSSADNALVTGSASPGPTSTTSSLTVSTNPGSVGTATESESIPGGSSSPSPGVGKVFMLKCNHEHCDAEVQKVDYEEDFASWGGPFCNECGHTMGGIDIISEVPDPASAIA